MAKGSAPIAGRDAPKRSIVKAISWRITGSIDTFILSWIFTGSPKVAISIASVEVFTKIFLFYLHERLWARTNWGLRKNNQDYSI